VFCGFALYSRYHDCDPWTAKKVSEADQVWHHIFLTHVLKILKTWGRKSSYFNKDTANRCDLVILHFYKAFGHIYILAGRARM
jgi:hypothetical protein